MFAARVFIDFHFIDYFLCCTFSVEYDIFQDIVLNINYFSYFSLIIITIIYLGTIAHKRLICQINGLVCIKDKYAEEEASVEINKRNIKFTR